MKVDPGVLRRTWRLDFPVLMYNIREVVMGMFACAFVFWPAERAAQDTLWTDTHPRQAWSHC